MGKCSLGLPSLNKDFIIIIIITWTEGDKNKGKPQNIGPYLLYYYCCF